MKLNFKMNKKNKSRSTPSLEVGLFAQSLWLLLSFVLFEFNSDLVFFFNLTLLFAPLPYAVLSLSRGCLHATFIAFVASISIALLEGIAPAATYFVLFSFSGVAFAFFLRKDSKDYADFLMNSTEALSYLKLGLIAILCHLLGRNVALPDEAFLQKALAPYASQLPNINLAENIKLFTQVSTKIFPTTLVIFVVTEIFVCYSILNKIAKKQGKKLLDMPRVSRWAFSQSLFTALVISFVFEIVARFAPHDLAVCGDIAFNIQQIVWAAFFLQGFACVMFFLRKRKVKPFLRYVLAFFTLLFGVPSCLLSLLGAADVMFNFRKL